MNRAEHLLCALAEEGAEAAVRVSKIRRFGFMDVEPGFEANNETRLWGELNDLFGVAEMLVAEFHCGGLMRGAKGASAVIVGRDSASRTEDALRYLQQACCAVGECAVERVPLDRAEHLERLWRRLNLVASLMQALSALRGGGGVSRALLDQKKAKVERFLVYSKERGLLSDGAAMSRASMAL